MIGINALARALLQPRRPRWRVFDLTDASARTVSFAVQAIAVVYALDYLARRIVSILSLPLSTSIVTTFIASLLYAAMLFLIVRTPLTAPSVAPGVPVSRWRPYWLKGLLIALAVVLVGASMLGYVALGRFIVTQLLTTGAGVLIVALLHVAIRGIVPEPAERPGGMSAIIEQRFNLDDFGRGQLARVLRGLLNIILFALAVPLLLLAWGMSGAEIMSWVRAAVFGFDVGGVRISLSRILVAFTLFVGLLVATRFVQRWLAAGALAQGRMDPGLANSIYTGAGYIGFAVAALAAISYAGFDITSLAIVAGALSVGIGFGLQSIVNNFVSGLILLVERPIKVGDWISIKEGEGYVRRIAVRSTEIETFGRASLIVPNSELITQTVVNLTHRNLLGRLKVKVRVSYQADPEHALESAAAGGGGEHLYPAASAAGRRARQPRRPSARIQRARLPRRHQPLAAGADRAAHRDLKGAARRRHRCAVRLRPRRPRARSGADGTACHGDDRRQPRLRSRSGAGRARGSGAAQRSADRRRGRAGRLRGHRRQRAEFLPVRAARRRREHRGGRDGAAHAGGQDAARARHRHSQPAAAGAPARSGRSAHIPGAARRGARAAQRQAEDAAEAPPRKPNGD